MSTLGVVVSPDRGADARISYTIFVNRDSKLFYIRSQPPINLRQFSKEERKLIEKERRQKALTFGDWISFEDAQVRGQFIENYKKEFPLFKSRCYQEHLQIKTKCVISPEIDGHPRTCLSELFGDVRINTEMAARFLPNVVYICWLSVYVSRTSSMEVSFGEYVTVAEDQELARCAEWNRTDPRFRLNVACFDPAIESDDEDCVATRRFYSNDVTEIYDGCGVLTGERTLYMQNMAHFAILIGYLNPAIVVEVGHRVDFDAMYNIYLNAYIVGHYRRSKNTLRFESKVIGFGTTYLLEISVKGDANLPFGYLWTKEKSLGIVSDVNGVVTPFLLGCNPQGVLSVFVEDMGPGPFCRFAIRQLSESASKKVKKTQCDVMKLHDAKGFLLDGNRVFAPDFSTLRIGFDSHRFPDLLKEAPGTWIVFSAEGSEADEGQVKFLVTSSRVFSVNGYGALETCYTEDGYVYKALCAFDKEIGVLNSRIFGLIDDPRQLTRKQRWTSEAFALWVIYAGGSSRTPFNAYFVGKRPAERPLALNRVKKTIGSQGTAFSNESPEISTFWDSRVEDLKSNLENSGTAEEDHDFVKGDVSSEYYKPCTKSDCLGRDLVRSVLNDRSLVREYDAVGGRNMVMQMLYCICED